MLQAVRAGNSGVLDTQSRGVVASSPWLLESWTLKVKSRAAAPQPRPEGSTVPVGP